jgi:hypothetical protein
MIVIALNFEFTFSLLMLLLNRIHTLRAVNVQRNIHIDITVA